MIPPPRNRNHTQRNSIDYADAPDFVIPLQDYESLSLKRARRSFERMEDIIMQTPSLARGGILGVIGHSSTERQSIVKPPETTVSMPPIQQQKQ